MIPTVNDVLTFARKHLGDTEVSGGQEFTNDFLQPYLESAYADMFRAFDLYHIPRIIRQHYYDVASNTSYLAPATAGIYNMGEPLSMKERGISTSVLVQGATVGAGFVDLTTAVHTFQNGDRVVVFGVLGLSEDVNDAWTIEAPDTTTVRLKGCVATGTWTGGGVVSLSAEDFIDMEKVDEILTFPPVGAALTAWTWQGDAFRFYPANVTRQVRIKATLSGRAPNDPSASLGVDDSRDFLSARVADLAYADKTGRMSEHLRTLALGANRDPDNPGGSLGVLIQRGVKQLQTNRYVPLPWRRARNVGPIQLW